MTLGRQYLQIPGPSNIPDRITRAMTQPLVDHRGPEFASLLADCTAGMKAVFQTRNDVLLLPSSGSGGLESAVVNALSPGDHVLAVVQGVFSDRFAQTAQKHGALIEKLEVEWGRAVDPDQVLDVLKKDAAGSVKTVLLSHNETSTGVLNDVKTIGLGLHEMGHPALLMVDSVSGLALADLRVDEWHVDVAITGSQKGLMLPPGMAFVSVSPKAWASVEKATMPRWYFDWKQIKSTAAAGRTAYTPPTSLMFGLREALTMISEEGLNNVLTRHQRVSRAVRQAARALGMAVLPPEEEASPSVTAVNQPGGVDQETMNRLLREKYNVVIGGGLQKLEGKIFRVGHMGQIHEPEVLGIMGALELVLAEMGADIALGEGLRACKKVFAEVR